MKTKKLLAFVFCACFAIFMLFSLSVFSRKTVYAETKEIYTTMLQKSSDLYDFYKETDSPVAHNVKLGKNKIVIYGTVGSFYGKTNLKTRHTYRLAKNVRFVSRGGDQDDQKMSKKEFKKYLKKVNDSGLGLVMEFKNNKVICVAVSS